MITLADNSNNNNWNIGLGLELRPDAISSINEQIKSIGSSTEKIKIDIDKAYFKDQINSIKDELSKLSMSSLSKGIKLSGTDNALSIGVNKKQVEEVSSAFRELMNLQRQIQSKRQGFLQLDSTKDINQMIELNNQIMELESKYTSLKNTFKERFSFAQLKELDQAALNAANSYSVLNAKLLDKSGVAAMKQNLAEEKEALKQAAQASQALITNESISRSWTDLSNLSSKMKELGVESKDVSHSLLDLSNKLSLATTNTDKTALNEFVAMYKTVAQEVRNVENAQKAQAAQASQALAQQKAQLAEFIAQQKKISNLKIKIGGLENGDGNANQIAVLKNQLAELEQSYEEAMHTFQKGFTSSDLTIEDFNKLNQVITNTELKLSELTAKYEDTRISMAQGIQTNITNGKLEKQISDIEVKFRQLSGDTGNVSTKIQELKTLMNSMDSNDDIESVIADYEKFKNLLAQTTNEVHKLQNEQNADVNTAKLSQSRTKLSADIDIWLSRNSAAAKQFGNQLEQIKAQISSADQAKLTNLQSQFINIKRQAEQAGVATKTFGDKLKDQLGKFGNFLTIPMLLTRAIQGLRTMYNDVLAIDTAMTELYRVTELTDQQYQKLYDNMTKSAKRYAVSLDTIIASTASWVRLGFDAETSNRLAEITAMYQHVTDLGEKEAVENLVTAYKGFQESLLKANNNDETQAILQIADIYDKLGNEFAESAADVGDGLSKSASVLQQGGASIQEAAGMFTGIQEVLQNSSTSGKALQIMTLRIRGMKGQLEELGEEVDENIDSISKIQTQILNLTQGRVNIFDDVGDFRNIYDIMRDIAGVWDSLSSQDSAALLEIIAGKNRSNAVQALINNWSQVEKATKAAYAAEGTATAENEKYLKSMQGRLDTLKASAQSLSATIMDSDTLKTGISLLNNIVNGLDTMIDKIGMFPTLVTAIFGGLSFKNIGRCKLFHLICGYADSNNSST